MRHLLLDSYVPYRPGERVRVLFLFQVASFWPSWESVYEAFQKDNRAEVRLVLVTRQAIERAQMVTARAFLDARAYSYELDEEFDIDAYRPHVVFVQSPYDLTFHQPKMLSLVLRRKGYRVVYIPYGIEIADTETARRDHFENFVVENSWRIYTCSKSMEREYRRYSCNGASVRALGSPKFDWFAEGKREYPSLAEEARAKGKKLVVWKMHFPKVVVEQGKPVMITPPLEEYLEFARGLEAFSGIHFLFLPHPKILYGIEAYDIKGEEEILRSLGELLGILEQVENISICMKDDYRPVLGCADAILLDRSGTMVEAAMTGKPILFLENAAYQEQWTPPIARLVHAFAKGHGCLEMKAFARDVQLGKVERYLAYRSVLWEEFPYRDGGCGERIKEDILEGIASSTIRKPRIVLCATGRIFHYYMEEIGWKNEPVFRIAGIVDSNRSAWGQKVYRWTIRPMEAIREMECDAVVVMSDFFYREIRRRLTDELFVDERDIWRLDEFVAYLCEEALVSAEY